MFLDFFVYKATFKLISICMRCSWDLWPSLPRSWPLWQSKQLPWQQQQQQQGVVGGRNYRSGGQWGGTNMQGLHTSRAYYE